MIAKSTTNESKAVLTPRTPKEFWLPIWTLTWRELLRFFRQRTRIVGALGQPLIF